MSGTIAKFTCPRCQERHVTYECPTCGHVQTPRVGGSHLTTTRPGAYHVTPVTQRRDAILAIMAEYAAVHPGATEANTNVLDVSLWLASRREQVAS